MFPSWLRSIMRKTLAHGTPLRRRRLGRRLRKPTLRPHVEQFEPRLVPTAISIPTDLLGAANATVVVPINVDILQDVGNGTIGMSGADFVVLYDTSVFSLAPANPVKLGTISTGGLTTPGNGYDGPNGIPNDWQLLFNPATPGRLNIGISTSDTGRITGAGTGTLVTIEFIVNASAHPA